MLSICGMSISSTTSRSPATRQKTPTALPWGLLAISPRVNGQTPTPAMMDNHYFGIGANTDAARDRSF